MDELLEMPYLEVADELLKLRRGASARDGVCAWTKRDC